MRQFWKIFSIALLVSLVLFGVGSIVGFVWVVKDLPDLNALKEYQPIQPSEVYSFEGVKIGEFATQRRYPITLQEVPFFVQDAFIVAEDAKFYEHKGIDFVGIARAMFTNILAGRFAQGASTITQQLARTLLLSREKTMIRKVKEVLLAWRMEQVLTKNQILELYLNEIYFGHGAYGLGAASQNYFRKRVEQLTLAEAALLAGLPQRPSKWDPFKDPQASKQRQQYVLHRLVEAKKVSQQDAQKAALADITLYPLKDLNKEVAAYFTEYVRTYLMKKYGDEKILTQGLKIYTTLKYELQKKAEISLLEGLSEIDKRSGWRGPKAKLATHEWGSFLDKTHQFVLELEGVPWILKKDLLSENNSLVVNDKFFHASKYFGQTPLKEGQVYDALVQSVAKDKALSAKVGRTDIVLTSEATHWVYEGQPKKEILVGDVIEIRVSKIDRKSRQVFAELIQKPEVEGAFLSVEVESGSVVAMIGGTDFEKSEFNRALQYKRQVGSTFKPIIYAAAIDKNYSPSSIVTDSPIVFKQEEAEVSQQIKEASSGEVLENQEWKPRNYGEEFLGEIPLRTALIKSLNVPTIKLLNEIDIDYLVEYSRRVGLTAPMPRDLTIALGSWSTSLDELMRAYSVFPRYGKPFSLMFVKKVVDRDGKVLEETKPESIALDPFRMTSSTIKSEEPLRSPPGEGLSISPQTSYVMIDLLKAVVREGTGTRAFIPGYPIAGKTGTSNNFHDAWFIGFSPHLMTGVWVGFDRDKALGTGEAGGKSSAPIFAEYMKYALTKYPKTDFVVPQGVVFAYIDKKTGRLSSPYSSDRVRVAFKEGQVPNSLGNNIPRIGEIGSQNTQEKNTASPNVFNEGDSEDSYLREGR